MNLTERSKRIHLANHHWWHTKEGVPIERNFQELLMLTVSEVAEAMEGERKNLMDDHLSHRKMAEVELADTVIRLLDLAAGFKLELGEVYVAHIAKNKGEALFQIVCEITYLASERDWLHCVLSHIISYCKKHSYDLEGAIEEKLLYNATRADHTYEAREEEGGKKF